jgi:tetratricopeptide (TPR) repeat protein
MVKQLATIVALFSLFTAHAQDGKKMLNEANALFRQGQYAAADSLYRIAMNDKRFAPESSFNLGDALYRQGKYTEAITAFNKAIEGSSDPTLKSDAWHNIGNSKFLNQDYEGAANAYKQALRLDPERDDTRQNLASAMSRMQKKEQKSDPNGDQNDKKNDDQKDDQGQSGNEDQKKDENQGEQKENEQGKDDKNQQGEQSAETKPKEHQISKEDAEKMLDALNRKEKDIQQSLQKKNKNDGKSKPIEKDW